MVRSKGEQRERRTQGEGERGGREKRGKSKLFLRHIALICPPAAKENDVLLPFFFFFLFFFYLFFPSWLDARLGIEHSWNQTVNKCNCYSKTKRTKKTIDTAFSQISLNQRRSWIIFNRFVYNAFSAYYLKYSIMTITFIQLNKTYIYYFIIMLFQ